MPNEKDFTAGMTFKSASVDTQEITPEELRAINKYTLSPLSAEDVFAFKMIMCDNEVDRDFERFTLKALKQLQKLFVGKTVLKDHQHRADNQVARIYSTELVQDSAKMTESGELYTQLIARCYIVKTADNEALIAEIKGGIKKEVSVGCTMNSAICSICGVDNAKMYCSHWAGREYEKDGKKSVCIFILDNAKDAYEVSLVAIPSQRNAGTCKSYGAEAVYDNEKTEKNTEKSEQSAEDIATAIKSLDAFIYVEKTKEDN